MENSIRQSMQTPNRPPAPPSPSLSVQGVMLKNTEILRVQSSIQDQASALASALAGLKKEAHSREEEITQLSAILQELKQQKSAGKCKDQTAKPAHKLQPSTLDLSTPKTSSHNRQEQKPQYISPGLLVLEDANYIFKQFQHELEEELSQLARHASTARITTASLQTQVVAYSPRTQGEVPAATAKAAHDAGRLADGLGTIAQEQETQEAGYGEQDVSTPVSRHASLRQQLRDTTAQGGTTASLSATGSDTWQALLFDSPEAAPCVQPTDQQGEGCSTYSGGKRNCRVDQLCAPAVGEQRTSAAGSDARPQQDQQASGGHRQSGGSISLPIESVIKQKDGVKGAGSYLETNDKVAGAMLELQAVGSELEELRRQALAEAEGLVAARRQRVAEESLLADLLSSRRAELGMLEQQLAALQAQLAESRPSPVATPAALEHHSPQVLQPPLGNGEDTSPERTRSRKRAKRQVVRRSASCSELVTLLGEMPPAVSSLGTPTFGDRLGASSLGSQAAGNDQMGQPSAMPWRSPGASRPVPPATCPVSTQTEPPTSACILCDCHQAQFQLACQQVTSLQQQLSKATFQLEQQRALASGKEAELVRARQHLRQWATQSGTISGAGTWGSEAGGPAPGVRRPLSIAGWEELIDQASSDLEQVEAQVAAAAERLADLQAQNLAAIEALEVVKQRRVQAEQVEASAHVALRGLSLQADELESKIAAQQAQLGGLKGQLAAATAHQQAVSYQISALSEEKSGLEAALAQLKEQVQQEEARLTQAQKGVMDSEATLMAARGKLGTVQQETAESEARLQDLQQLLASARAESDAAAAETVTAKEALAEARMAAEAAHLRRLEVEAEVVTAGSQLSLTKAAVEATEQDLRQAQSQLATLQQSIQRSLPQQQELEAAIHSLDKQHLEAVAAKQELAAELAASKQSLQEAQVSAAEQARKAEAASAQLRSAEERLADVNAQVARAQQQLSDLQEQIAAARQQQLSVASNTHLTNAHVQHHQQAPAGVLHTPGSGSGLLLLQHGGLSPPPHEHRGLRGSMQGSGSLVAVFQLQAQVEQLQLAVSQAESRRRSAEARAGEAEREVEDLTVRVASLQRRERSAAAAALADAAAPHHLEPSGSVARLRAKVEELEAELESSQRQSGRHKSKAAALTEEVTTLEEALTRERAQTARLRQQLAEAEHTQELSRQPPQLLGPHARRAADLAASTEAASVQLQQLQQQVSRQQEVVHELSEQERSLRAQCAELRSSLDAAVSEQAAACAQLSAAKRALSQLASEHEEEQEALRATREERAAEQRRLGDARRALSQVEAALEELLTGRVVDVQAHLHRLQQDMHQTPQPGAAPTQRPPAPACATELALLRAELQAVRARAEAAELKDKTTSPESAQHSTSLDLASLQNQVQALVQQQVVAQQASLAAASFANVRQQEAAAAAGVLQHQVSALQAVLNDTHIALSTAQQELLSKQAALAAAEQQESAAQALLTSLQSQQAQALEELAAVRRQVQAQVAALTSLVAAGVAGAVAVPVQAKLLETASRVLHHGKQASQEAVTISAGTPSDSGVLQDLHDQLMHLMLQREAEAGLRAELDTARQAAAAAEARAQGAEKEAGARLAQAHEDRQTLMRQLATADALCVQLQHDLQAAKDRQSRLQAASEQAEAQVTAQAQVVTDLHHQLASSKALEAKLLASEEEVEKLQQKVTEQAQELVKAALSQHQLSELQSQLAAQEEQARTALQEAALHRANLQAALAEAEADRSALQVQVSQLRQDLREAQQLSAAGQAAASLTAHELVVQADARAELAAREAQQAIHQAVATAQAAVAQATQMAETAVTEAAARVEQAEARCLALIRQAEEKTDATDHALKAMQGDMQQQEAHFLEVLVEMESEIPSLTAQLTACAAAQAQQAGHVVATLEQQLKAVAADAQLASTQQQQLERTLMAKEAALKKAKSSVTALEQQALLLRQQKSDLQQQLDSALMRPEVAHAGCQAVAPTASAGVQVPGEGVHHLLLREAGVQATTGVTHTACQAGVTCTPSACQTEVKECCAAACQTGAAQQHLHDVGTQSSAADTWADTHKHALSQTDATEQWPSLADAAQAAADVSEALIALQGLQKEHAHVLAQCTEHKHLLEALIGRAHDLAAAEAGQQASAAQAAERLQALKQQESQLLHGCNDLRQCSAAIRAELQREMRAIASAVQQTTAQWAVSRQEMEAECQVLHDTRVSLLTAAVEVKQEVQQGMSQLRGLGRVHATVAALQQVLPTLGQQAQDRQLLQQVVAAVQGLVAALDTLTHQQQVPSFPPHPPTSSLQLHDTSAPVLTTANSSGVQHRKAASTQQTTDEAADLLHTIMSACHTLRIDLSQLRSQSAAQAQHAAAVGFEAKRSFVFAHAKAKAFYKLLQQHDSSQQATRGNAGAAAQPAPEAAAEGASVPPGSLHIRFKEMWRAVEEQLGKLLKAALAQPASTHDALQPGGQGLTAATPSHSSPDQLQRQPHTLREQTPELERRLAAVSALALRLESSLRQAADASSSGSSPLTHQALGRRSTCSTLPWGPAGLSGAAPPSLPQPMPQGLLLAASDSSNQPHARSAAPAGPLAAALAAVRATGMVIKSYRDSDQAQQPAGSSGTSMSSLIMQVHSIKTSLSGGIPQQQLQGGNRLSNEDLHLMYGAGSVPDSPA